MTPVLNHSIGLAFTDNPDHADGCSFTITDGEPVESGGGWGFRGLFPEPNTTIFGEVGSHHTVCVVGGFTDGNANAIRDLVDAHLERYRECRLAAAEDHVRERDLRVWITTGCQMGEEEVVDETEEEEETENVDDDAAAETDGGTVPAHHPADVESVPPESPNPYAEI